MGNRASMQTATQARHTPGPWEQEREATVCKGSLGDRLVEYAGVVHRTDSGVTYICDCWGLDEDGNGDEPSETAEANAALIAAAPDLLELVRLAACPLGIGSHEFTRPGGWRERAQAAIAAATGER
jgi:hypothetical protein